ncbi:MAG: PASTA domain-containing protein, partial [Candidatus Eiseniibacteriota bacterium]
SQSPAAGEAVERGESIALLLSAPADSLGRRMPDLSGLAVREALRRLTPLEVIPHLEGHGVVVRQLPEPGAPIARRARCDLWCEAEPQHGAAAAPRTGTALMAAAAPRAGGRP